MKRLFVYLFLFLFIFITLAQAQFKFEITQEFKNKQVEITVTGKSFNEVWKAITRTLMSLKFQIKERDKDNGTVFAQKRPNIFHEEGDVLSAWNIMIETDEEETILFCVYTLSSDNLFGTGKKAFKKFREKLQERLKEVKKE